MHGGMSKGMSLTLVEHLSIDCWFNVVVVAFPTCRFGMYDTL